MTDTTTPAELEIPQVAADTARDAFWDCLPDTYDEHDMAFLACRLEEYALPAAARGIVAAELRRIAAEMTKRNSGESKTGRPYRDAYAVAIAGLRARADELDGGLR